MLRCVEGRPVRALSLTAALGLAATLAMTGVADAKRGHGHHRRGTHAARNGGGGYSPPFSAMVVDAGTGRTMYAVNEDEPRHPASITTGMTLYMLFEQLEKGAVSLDTEFKVSAHAASQAPSKIGFRPGDTIEVEDAIKAVVTKSANDVACAIAENIAGSEEDFAERMTRKARQLGMSGTVYRNASGLPNPEQITTARDLTILGRAIQERFPRYYRYFQTHSFTYAGRTIGNHNRLLGKIEGVDGIKTGFTNASGFNLLTSARLDGRHVVGAVLGGKSAASRDAIMAGLIRTNLARASVGASTSVLAASERTERQRVRLASAADMDSAVATTSSTRPSRVLELAAKPEDAPAPMPPSTSAKIEARLPVMAAAPTPPEPPARIELASAAKPEPETRRETAKAPPTVSPWVIQLAAEQDEKDARAVLDSAKSKSGRLLAKAAPFTEKVNRGGSTLYRARFSGFSEADAAQEACRTLKRSGFSCFATRS